MQIKRDKPVFVLVQILKKYSGKIISFRFLTVFAILCVLVLYSLGLLYYGMIMNKTGRAGTLNDLIHNLLVAKFDIVTNTISGKLSKPKKIYIDIKFKNYQKILGLRKIVIERDYFGKFKDLDFPVKFTSGGREVKAKIQLTGQNLDHVIHDKWSFRVKIKGENSFMGMKEFSILNPLTRGNLSEWVVHQLEKKEGLISLRYDFVNVFINGKDMGIYVIEEHFDKRLVENHGLREGLLFGADSRRVKIYNKKKVYANKVLSSQIEPLQRRWKNFLTGKLLPEKIFDIEKMARFYAIADLVQGNHTHYLFNEKFYLNPVTNLVEPVGREYEMLRHSDVRRKIPFKLFIEQYMEGIFKLFNSRLFASKKFVKLYISELKKISEKKYLDSFYGEIKKDMEIKLSYIHKDNPAYSYPFARLYQHQKYMRQKLELKTSLLNAYFENRETDSVRISVENLSMFPLVMDMIKYNGRLVKRFEDMEFVLKSRRHNNIRSFEQIDINLEDKILKDDFNADSLEVFFNVIGMNEVNSTKIFPYSIRTGEILNGPENYSDLEKISYIKYNKETGFHEFMETGEIIVKKDLIIKSGLKLKIFPGTTINLINGAKIISHSSIDCNGTDERKIKFISSDNSGQGLTVLRGEKSVFKNVIFKNLSSPSTPGWSLSGSVNLYETETEIDNCRFENNLVGDDMLNLIRSQFIIRDSKFIEVNSDAIDSDFSTGSVENTEFLNIGNDAIDVSGTVLTVKGLKIDNSGDKAISGGEKSTVNGSDIEIFNSEIGVSSKDLSIVTLENLNINKCRIGFAVFQKKTEYGPGKVFVNNVKTSGIEKFKLLEKGSELTVENVKYQPDGDDVKNLLYGAVYGKSSK